MVENFDRDRIEQNLLKDFIILASALSPGVRLKIQSQFSSFDSAIVKSDSKSFINDDRKFLPKSPGEPVRKKHILSKYSKDGGRDDKVKKPENWMLIYNLLEKKRKDYRKEKEEEILAHSMESKKKLERYKVRERIRNEHLAGMVWKNGVAKSCRSQIE